MVTTRPVRFMPRREWLRGASKLTTTVLIGIWLSMAQIGCTHYNTVEPLPGSGLSQILSPDGQMLCTGRWSSEGPDGPWDFYEGNGDRIATIMFSQGAAAGQLRFYWGSQVFPNAAGKPQVIGTVRDGKFEHRWIRYSPNGSVTNETVYWDGEMMTTRSFSSEGAELSAATAIARARQLDEADHRLLHSLLKIVHRAKLRAHATGLQTNLVEPKSD
jgi:hypothetical protein